MFICPKYSSQTVNGSNLKFAYVFLYAIPRTTVLFSNVKLSNFCPFLNRMPALNSRGTESYGGLRTACSVTASRDGSTGLNPVAEHIANRPGKVLWGQVTGCIYKFAYINM